MSKKRYTFESTVLVATAEERTSVETANNSVVSDETRQEDGMNWADGKKLQDLSLIRVAERLNTSRPTGGFPLGETGIEFLLHR